MAASQTLPQGTAIRKFPIGKNGVLTLSGYGIKVRMQSGHLEIEDGVGPERRTIRLPRVGHGLRRLVCISEDGFVTLSALQWLADIEASFVMLDRLGKVQFVTGPTAPSDARLRRSQAVALGNGVGLEISRALIDAKLQGQQRLLRERLNDPANSDVIVGFRERLHAAESVEVIRILEAHAAISYFSALRNIRVLWPTADLGRIPEHWKTVGSRRSPLSGGPRLAVTPVHAILNFCFALLESETRLAVSALGLDPGLGLGLHTDTPNRDSLALDVLEPVRPDVEAWVLKWIACEPLCRADFFENANGNCRLTSHLCSKLSETANVWGRLVAPWAEYVQRALWANTSRYRSSRLIPTRLTQQHRRNAKGAAAPRVVMPKPHPLCLGCGARVRKTKTYCAVCSEPVTRDNFDAGRKLAQHPESLAKRSATQRQHKQAISSWKPSDLPAWLTRDVYLKQVQPALASVAKSRIRAALGVSEPYSSNIQAGKRMPHRRHWHALAELVNIGPTYRGGD